MDAVFCVLVGRPSNTRWPWHCWTNLRYLPTFIHYLVRNLIRCGCLFLFITKMCSVTVSFSAALRFATRIFRWYGAIKFRKPIYDLPTHQDSVVNDTGVMMVFRRRSRVLLVRSILATSFRRLIFGSFRFVKKYFLSRHKQTYIHTHTFNQSKHLIKYSKLLSYSFCDNFTLRKKILLKFSKYGVSNKILVLHWSNVWLHHNQDFRKNVSCYSPIQIVMS